MRGLNPNGVRRRVIKFTFKARWKIYHCFFQTLFSQLWFSSSGFLWNIMRAPQFCSHRSLALVPWVPEIFSHVWRGASSGRHVFGRRNERRSGSLFKTVLGVQMVGSEFNCTRDFFPFNFSPGLYYLKAWNRLSVVSLTEKLFFSYIFTRLKIVHLY